jgi:hypothetical protein
LRLRLRLRARRRRRRRCISHDVPGDESRLTESVLNVTRIGNEHAPAGLLPRLLRCLQSKGGHTQDEERHR